MIYIKSYEEDRCCSLFLFSIHYHVPSVDQALVLFPLLRCWLVLSTARPLHQVSALLMRGGQDWKEQKAGHWRRFVLLFMNPFWKINLNQKRNLSTGCLPLLQILENEDLSGQSEDESSQVVVMSSSEVCDAVSRFSLMGRRGSLQSPEVTKVFIQGRRHSTGQALTYRWEFTDYKHVWLCWIIVIPRWLNQSGILS